MVFRDDYEKRLLDAMAMEKEYRKLRLDHRAKTEFGYHDKLKAVGFNDTIEYEKAKSEYYLANTQVIKKSITSDQSVNEIAAAVKNKTPTA